MDFIYIGDVVNTHGLKGEIRIVSDFKFKANAFKVDMPFYIGKDKTKEIAEKYRNRFRYFRIINKPNGGLSDARNVGMANVETPYFTFHDGDDWVDPGYTSYFVRAFHTHPNAAMVSCGFWIDREHSKHSIPATKKVIHAMLSKKKTYRLIVNFLGSLFMNKIFISPKAWSD